MKILQYISELLLIHDCVIVPGFGGFIATHVPAKIQPVVNSFTPPKKEIIFNSGIRHNDGILATYIAKEENISYAEALAMIDSFVEECHQALNDKGCVEFLHVGAIHLDSNNFFRFQQDPEQNLLLSSYGLSNFISPAIQRDGIEKRIEKVFAENRTLSSDQKSSGVWTKVAMISVPAAAIFVWAFLNVNTISDVSNNYTNLTSIFSGRSQEVSGIVKPAKHTTNGLCDVYENTLDIQNSKSVFRLEQKTLYPCFTENTNYVEINPDEAVTAAIPEVPGGECKFFIIGSCNRNKDLAENYKSKLIGKGYRNANIIEPKGNGLFKVYIDCFDTETAAQQELSKIQDSENTEAWLLKM